MIDNSKERAIAAANPSMHWSDVMIQADKAATIDLRELITARLNKICAEHIAKSEAMRPQSSAAPLKPLQGLDSIQKFSALSSSPPHASNAQIVETNREDAEEEQKDEAAEGE